MDLILDEILHHVRLGSGVDLSGYRRTMLRRRLQHRLSSLGLPSESAYLRLLQDDPEEIERFLKLVSINVSEFFRDPVVFDVLADQILPDLIARKRAHSQREFRVWCAGCASGEEVYSVAIMLRSLVGSDAPEWRFFLFGSDIDERALAVAAEGCYPPDRVMNVRLGLLKKWFEPSGEDYRLTKAIRTMVSFSREDLLSKERSVPRESVFSGFDLVFCRNVLIYFTSDQQRPVISRLSAALQPGGVLVLGRSEDIDVKGIPGLRVLERRFRIYGREEKRHG